MGVHHCSLRGHTEDRESIATTLGAKLNNWRALPKLEGLHRSVGLVHPILRSDIEA